MKLFVERPVATAMFFLAVLVLGVSSFLNTPLELAPKEEFPQVDIRTPWPGVSPEIVQAQVTAPLEELASAVRGVRKISSSSELGGSRITLEIGPKANMEFVNLALREALAKARPTLPYGVRPTVEPYVPEDLRVRPFLTYTISGDYPLQKLRELVKDKLEFGIGSVRNVSRVEVTGGADPEIRVVLDERRLQDLGIHPYQVNAALSQGLRTFPAGRMKRGARELIFRLADEVRGLGDLRELIVAYSGAVPIRLGDVARVVPAYGDIESINRIDGRPTVMLRVLKEKGSNSLKVAADVKKKLEKIKQDLPPDLIFKTVDDESGEILKNLHQLYLLAGIIAAVVFVLIFVVLRRLAPSLLILSSIAFSVVITFNLIYVFKISLNMLTLGALALGFGMFVDDSIVVFENILRLRENGLPPVRAAIEGSREVFLPVLASTLTIVSVFFCFPYFQGRLRLYYLPLAVAMASALSASLLVSFTLIPALSPRLLKLGKTERGGAGQRSRFERVLGFFVRHPVEVLLIVLVVLYGSYKWFRKEVTLGDFFRWSAEERLYVSIEMPPGTEITKTDDVIRKFERRVLDAGFKDEMNTSVSPERAFVVISFPPEVERSSVPYALKDNLVQLATQFAGISIYISGFDPQGYYSSMEMGTYYDSRIKFFGYNLKKLKEITADLETRLKRNPRIKDVKTISSRYGWGWRLDSFEYALRIDREALKRYRIDPAYLYFHIQTLLPGRFGVPLRLFAEGKEREIKVKFPRADEMDLKAFRDALIKTPDGDTLRLGEISTLEERPVAGSIDRENQQFQQTLMWEFRGPTKAAENYRKGFFSSLRLPPGFSATMEETWRMTEEEKTQIKFAVLFSLVIIFMILAALYESLVQPFFIMLAVPLELVGVFLAFVIAGYPFDSSAYIGVIILGGIVVKNAILVVDHINLKRRQGMPLLDAVLRGTRERVRPIFMTTSTTVFGILPMLLVRIEAGRRQIWSALALCTAGGLVSSTIFVLMVVPIFYYYGDHLRAGIAAGFRAMAAALRKDGKI